MVPPSPSISSMPASVSSAAHALALDVAAEQRVEHGGAAQADEPERLAGGGRAEGLVLVERELHVRHRLGQVIEQHDAVPRSGPGDEDVIGHPLILADRAGAPHACDRMWA